MSFINLEAGARTYIASLKVDPNFSGALAAGTRADRKTAAYGAMVDAEVAVKTTLLPKLDALKAEGLVRSYDFATGTGALILNVDDTRASAAFQALQGLDELGRIVRNEEVKLDAVVEAKAPAVAAGEKTVEWNVGKVGVEQAWASGVTGEGVVVGIVDTGANTAHEALKGHYRGTQADGTMDHNYNFFDATKGRKDAYDDNKHGTHVSGTIAGAATEGHAATGVAPGAKLIGSKILTASGSGTLAGVMKGLEWMLAPTDSEGKNADPSKAPDIISNSWGTTNGKDESFRKLLQAFLAAGIEPVFAAGNSGPRGGSLGAPGSSPEVISVAATDKDDKVASFSSRGPSPIKDAKGSDRKPDISAPGHQIVSTVPGGGYASLSGTSMATPAVSGVIALLLSKHKDLTHDEIVQAINTTGKDIDTPCSPAW